MNYLKLCLSQYPFSCCLTLLIWVICVIPVPENPLSGVTLIDKWTHIGMYAVLCSIIWQEYLHRHKQPRGWQPILYTGLMPLCMSGIIEMVQEYCTGGNRSGDWIDFAANAIGVGLGQVIGMLLAKYYARGKKDSEAGENCRNGGRR